MDITVTPDRTRPQHGTLSDGTRRYDCVLGRSGVSAHKREGDGATPVGRFRLRRVFYRDDRGPAPKTSLPTQAITATSGWCDAPNDPAYNTPVTLPYSASAEPLWRDDGLYDIVVVLGYNDAPVVPGGGSAIFLHVAPSDGGPTAGCVALGREDLRNLLIRADADTALVVTESV